MVDERMMGPSLGSKIKCEVWFKDFSCLDIDDVC
jgi:hypothetical protein